MAHTEADFDDYALTGTGVIPDLNLGLDKVLPDESQPQNVRRGLQMVNRLTDALLSVMRGRRVRGAGDQKFIRGPGKNIGVSPNTRQVKNFVRVARLPQFAQYPLILKGTISTSFSSADATFTVTNLRSMLPVYTKTDETSVTVPNTFGWSGTAGTTVIIAFDQDTWAYQGLVMPSGLLIAYCTADVTQATGGNKAYISAKLCSKVDGSDYAGDTLTVYFPTTHAGQPAVFSGDVINISRDKDGLWYAVGDYGDDYIGSIKIWSGAVNTIPAHWQFCDGTNSTPDLRGRFIVCADFDSDGHTANHTDEGVDVAGGCDNLEVRARQMAGIDGGNGATVKISSGYFVDSQGSGYSVGEQLEIDGTDRVIEVLTIGADGELLTFTNVSGTDPVSNYTTTTSRSGITVVTYVDNYPSPQCPPGLGGTSDCPDNYWTGLTENGSSIVAVDKRPLYYALAYIMRWK